MSSIRPLDREVLGEILGNLDEIEAALGGLSHRDAVAPIRIVQGVRELLGECLPGGYIGNCEYCENPIGLYEVGASDHEDGGHACKACVAKDPDFFRRDEANRADKVKPLADYQSSEHQTAVILSAAAASIEPSTTFDTEQREPPEGHGRPDLRTTLPPGFSIAEDGALVVPDRDDRGTEITRLRGSSAFLDRFPEVRTVSGRTLKSATGDLPACEVEELQLLRQLLRGPYATAHSATKAIAERLLKKGHVFYVVDGSLAQLEITRAGKMRLEGGNG